MTKKYVFRNLLNIILICFLSNCISDYVAVGVKDTEGILVVEGIILEEGTTIKLSRSVKLDDRLPGQLSDVLFAHIEVIDENNNVIATAASNMTTPGTYMITDKITFTPGMKYALDIQIDNKHYRSDFVAPVHTPDIDELSWKSNEDNSIDILVSTHDPVNETLYYRWAFEEDWEIRSKEFGAYIYNPFTGEITPQSQWGPNNKYYCWASDYSKSFLLGSSGKFMNAVIKDHKIHNFKPGSTRFSYLYSILVKQYGLNKEAYDYFENLQRNVDESGSLFAPQPSEKSGNIQCLSNPDEPVIGYVVFTKEIVNRLYIEFAFPTLEDEFSCGEERECSVYELYDAYLEGWGIRNAEWPGPSYICVPIRCVDCTLRGGTKNKPDFWPNDHQ